MKPPIVKRRAILCNLSGNPEGPVKYRYQSPRGTPASGGSAPSLADLHTMVLSGLRTGQYHTCTHRDRAAGSTSTLDPKAMRELLLLGGRT
jgi:hypothetical protein